MWADNETNSDLLGFDYLVDSLELVLTDKRLYPVTVGVLGDWGSGKTSLMGMTATRLRKTGDYLCIPFSPWRFESYDAVKTALMTTVINALERRVQLAENAGGDPGRLKQARETIGRLRSRLSGFAAAAAPGLGTVAAGAVGLPPEVGAVGGQVAAAALQSATDTDSDVEGGPEGQLSEYTSGQAFREDFKALVAGLDEVKAVIVFVDDLDRCLPDTIIETFEAIRLFLHVPKTAYVLAAHPEIVEAAVAFRYAGNRDGDANLGRDYLEKIIQLPIAVPALAEPEAETYVNLLFAELFLDDDKMRVLREAAQRKREQNQLAVCMNYGIAQEALADPVPDELQKGFEVANSIGPTLARGLRGNPRQLKRFLNTLVLRMRTADKRGTKLDPAVLAKLMVLELTQPDFQQVFEWQLVQDGQPRELAIAEAGVRGEPEPDDTPPDLSAWAAKSHIRRWLELEPPLAGVSLGPYFFFSREKLSAAAPAARLSGVLQELLVRLQSTVAATRRGAFNEVEGLDMVGRTALYEALTERATRHPGDLAMRSAIEIAAKIPELVPTLVSALTNIPATGVPPALPPVIATTFSDLPPELDAIMDRWKSDGTSRLKAAVDRARNRGRGN